jgi:hypothetical protein
MKKLICYLLLLPLFISCGHDVNIKGDVYINPKIINNYYSTAYLNRLSEGDHTFSLCDTTENHIFIIFDPTIGSGATALENFRSFFSLPLNATAQKILVPGSTISFVIPAVGYKNPSFIAPLLTQSFYLEPDLVRTSLDWVENKKKLNIIINDSSDNLNRRNNTLKLLDGYYPILSRYVSCTDSMSRKYPQESDIFGALSQAVSQKNIKTTLLIFSDCIVNLPRFKIFENEVISKYRSTGRDFNSTFDWAAIKNTYPIPSGFKPNTILIIGATLDGAVRSAVKDLLQRFYSSDTQNNIDIFFDHI